MLAGKTKYKVGAKVRIISSTDDDLIGVTGELTHPFTGLMSQKVKYVAGLRLDQEGIFSGNICNLMKDDIIEVL